MAEERIGVSSLRISPKAFSHGLTGNTKRGFLFPRFVFDRRAATRNEEMPDPCDVKSNEGKKGNKKMKKLIMCCIALTCAAILSGCGKKPSTDVVEDFYTAIRIDNREESDKIAERVLTPQALQDLDSNRDMKRIFAEIRMSKDNVEIDVVKEKEVDGVKKSVVLGKCNSTKLYFVVKYKDGVCKISDIAGDAYHVSW